MLVEAPALVPWAPRHPTPSAGVLPPGFLRHSLTGHGVEGQRGSRPGV